MKAGEFEFPFEKLEVYKMAVDLAERVLFLLEGFPGNKHFRLIGSDGIGCCLNFSEYS